MTRRIAKWLIVIAFAIYGAYTAWLALFSTAWFWLWAIPCFGAAIGVALLKSWGGYLAYFVATCTALGWAAFIAMSVSRRGWPYPDISRNLISLVPGLLLVAVCGIVVFITRKLIKHGKAT